MSNAKPLTEDEIAALTAKFPSGWPMTEVAYRRLLATLRAEQAARVKAEAEIENSRRWLKMLAETLNDIAKAVDYEPGPDAYEIIARVRRVVAARSAAEAQRDRLMETITQIARHPGYAHELARAALAEIDAPPTGWRPIETAPRDKRKKWFWAFYPVPVVEDQQCVASWVDAEGRFEDAADSREFAQPTHWMPLPAPPTGGDQ